MFDGLVTGMMASAVQAVAGEERVTELRMRVGRPLMVLTAEPRAASTTAVTSFTVSRVRSPRSAIFAERT